MLLKIVYSREWNGTNEKKLSIPYAEWTEKTVHSLHRMDSFSHYGATKLDFKYNKGIDMA